MVHSTGHFVYYCFFKFYVKFSPNFIYRTSKISCCSLSLTEYWVRYGTKCTLDGLTAFGFLTFGSCLSEHLFSVRLYPENVRRPASTSGYLQGLYLTGKLVGNYSEISPGPHSEGQERHFGSVCDRASGQSEETHADDAPGAEPGVGREVLLVRDPPTRVPAYGVLSSLVSCVAASATTPRTGSRCESGTRTTT